MANQTGGTQMPVANQAAADRASTTSRARMQANSAAPSAGAAMMAGPAAAQKAAGVQAQEQGQIAAQAQEAVVQKSVGQAQQELHNTQLRQKEQQTIHAEAMGKRHASAKNRMNSFGRDIKQKLFEDQLTFDKTERETRFANQRQMADFMSIKAADEQSIKNYEQSVQAAVQKDIIMMESAFKALQQAEIQAATDSNRRLDKESAARIKKAKEILEAKIKKSRRRGAYVKQGLGVAKMAVGATAMYYTGGTVGGSLVVSGGSEAVAAEQEK
jgi:hypothetical protein